MSTLQLHVQAGGHGFMGFGRHHLYSTPAVLEGDAERPVDTVQTQCNEDQTKRKSFAKVPWGHGGIQNLSPIIAAAFGIALKRSRQTHRLLHVSCASDAIVPTGGGVSSTVLLYGFCDWSRLPLVNPYLRLGFTHKSCIPVLYQCYFHHQMQRCNEACKSFPVGVPTSSARLSPCA